MTDHQQDISQLRARASKLHKIHTLDHSPCLLEELACSAAADLIECHVATGLDLQASSAISWLSLVETLLGRELIPAVDTHPV